MDAKPAEGHPAERRLLEVTRPWSRRPAPDLGRGRLITSVPTAPLPGEKDRISGGGMKSELAGTLSGSAGSGHRDLAARGLGDDVEDHRIGDHRESSGGDVVEGDPGGSGEIAAAQGDGR